MIRVIIADDHAMFVAGLRGLLEKQLDIQVVGEVREGLDAVHMAALEKPHVILMDVSMPGMNGIEATQEIVSAQPQTRVLCLSMHGSRQFVSAALDAGASGYVLKECGVDELVRAVRTVAAGHVYISPAVAGTLVAEFVARRGRDGPTVYGILTDRERQVLQLLAEGHSAKAIAGRLHVSVKTVATHREHIMRKLDIYSVAGLTRYAILEGLTTTELSHRPHYI